MKPLRMLAAGLAIALSPAIAAAHIVTLGFDDLPASGGVGGFFGTDAPFNYKGFNFDNATGTGGAWFWKPDELAYPTFPPGGNNITPTWSVAPPPGVYDAAVISSTVPFKFVSAVITGPGGPIGIELVDTSGVSYFLGPHFNSPSDLGTGSAATSFGGTFALNGTDSLATAGSFAQFYTNTEQSSLLLKEIVFWGQGYTYAVDNIVVNVVPEPSAYAMALVGLAGMALLARRRRQ